MTKDSGEPMQQEWISTGKAARILGYSPDHFREKFTGLIPSHRPVGCHTRWLESAVRELAQEPVRMPEAG